MLKVIALGNTLRADDGIGPSVIDALQSSASEELQLFDLGCDAFDLLGHLQNSDPILLIDCTRMGEKPGTVRRFSVEEGQLNRLDRMVSLHGFSFSEIYRLAQGLGPVAPCGCIGIEPASVAFGGEMSPQVRASIPSVVQMVFEEMHLYEEENNYY